jgi:hypothetical protein
MSGAPGNARDSLGVQALRIVVPQKSPGCQRVPGLFFCYQRSLWAVSFSTASRRTGAKPGGPWMGGEPSDSPVRLHLSFPRNRDPSACKLLKKDWRQAVRQDRQAYSLTHL